MIQANELRIGNWVTYPNYWNNIPLKIKIVGITEDLIFYGEESTLKLENAEPIPLTEELIRKIKNDIDINQMRDQLLFSIDDVSYYLKDRVVEAYTTNQSEPTATVSSLHELQNVHFALRKKELEL